MGRSAGLVSLDSRDLGAEPGDSLVELFDGQGIEVFLAEIDDRLAGLEIILLVHGSQR